jgi:lincosamide nucleotidyltransferase B/F
MGRKEQLLTRLNAIGESLAQSGSALALLGLGSVGNELDRLDDYSDLDFFVIVKAGQKRRFIQNLNWIEAVHPVVYTFQNTEDGYKLMFEDGIFCEFAVFEPHELAHIPFAAGRTVWKEPDFDDAISVPIKPKTPKALDAEWQVGEALTNLYVGLCRYWRGEKLSAARFVQGYAVDRIVELSALVETEQNAHKDPFVGERRYEQRFPLTAQKMAEFIQGYERTPQSAKAILEFVEQHFSVNQHMKNMILVLCSEALNSEN